MQKEKNPIAKKESKKKKWKGRHREKTISTTQFGGEGQYVKKDWVGWEGGVKGKKQVNGGEKNDYPQKKLAHGCLRDGVCGEKEKQNEKRKQGGLFAKRCQALRVQTVDLAA